MHMFRQVSEPRFVVLERVVAENGALLVWELRYRPLGRGGRREPQVIRGASHLRFDADGKVVWHRDYWDAAEELYAKLPGIGWLMRALRRRLAA
jgi:steroid delta-isomerase